MEDRDLDQLRLLLTAPLLDEIRVLDERIVELEQRLMNTENRAEAVGEVLSEAAKARRHHLPVADAEFSEAIRPEVELAIHQSSRVDVDVMADALYPVLGPAIRKMIAGLFNPNGSSFAVDRVILIDRNTGLPMQQHLVDHGDAASDAADVDVVAGMLDAIRSFVEDAFDTPEFDGLNDLRVGDISVIMEWGPAAGLAVVTRGVAPAEFRDSVRAKLEELHRRHGQALNEFSGDDDDLAGLVPELAELNHTPPAPQRWKAVAAAIAILIALLTVMVIVAVVVNRLS